MKKIILLLIIILKTKNKKEIVKYKQNKENNLINLSFNGLIY